MAKTKTKAKKKTPAKKSAASEKKTILTIEDPPAAAPTPKDSDVVKRLRPFIVNAARSPIQSHIDHLLQSTILSAIQGSEIDADEVHRALCSVKIGGKTLAEIVERVEEVEDILKKL